MYSSSLSSLDSKSLVIQMNCLLLIVVKWKEPPVKLLLTFRSAIRLSLTEIVNRVYFIFYLVSNGLRWKLSEPAASNSLWLWLIRVVSAFFHWSLVWSSPQVAALSVLAWKNLRYPLSFCLLFWYTGSHLWQEVPSWVRGTCHRKFCGSHTQL